MTNHRATLAACALSFLAGTGAMWVQQQAPSATRREPQFENDDMKVWK